MMKLNPYALKPGDRIVRTLSTPQGAHHALATVQGWEGAGYDRIRILPDGEVRPQTCTIVGIRRQSWRLATPEEEAAGSVFLASPTHPGYAENH